MQAPRATTTSPGVTAVNNTSSNPLDTIQGLTRYEKDADEEASLYFEDIMQRLKGPLLDSLRKSKKNYRPFAIRLLVLGRDESSAKPYIVVFCPVCVSDLVRNYFRRETSKRLCQPGKAGPASFEVIVEGNPIRPTTSHHLHPTSVKTGHPISGRRRHRNTPLKIDGICGTRYATMGGYIIVVNKQKDMSLYGLTAGHSIVQDDFEGEVESEQAGEEPNAERSLFPEIAPAAPSQIPESAMSRTMHNTMVNLATNSQEEIEWSGVANVAPASFSTQACDRDWALLAGIADQAGSGIQDGQIFERYVLGDPGIGTALIDDGMDISLQPPFIARLSRLPSFALLPYGNDFVRVYTFTTPNAGTSGRKARQQNLQLKERTAR
ncbi:uncharacterized protein J4E88_006245 [Alternaria novae-zelandiae]|uniref:uncharacterized protein n=1 Tax=Alternaria novae-zelandiae TaxID=430562 RepID=UPI0020C5735C|nr:uncharacterized protein J4E88_006245 [Alternaria novae-zelandiae]KAI4678957.1 hypothetical protein J4E88_006245 [Alternaria novae-zelandiae]